ncbi:MAG: hypothetical protein J0M11_20790 [Anaerolineae bacterium]|nr:hypothetical protein [Anaerolineae bacterium]
MRKISKLVLQVTLLGFEMMVLYVFAAIAQPSLDTNIVARTGLYDSRTGARQHTYNLSWHMDTPSVSLPENPSASNLANAVKGLFNSRLEFDGNGYTSHPIISANSPLEMTFTVNIEDAASVPVHFTMPDMEGIVVASRIAATIIGGVRSN